MATLCTEGHEIPEGQVQCAYGHPQVNTQESPGEVLSSLTGGVTTPTDGVTTDMQQLIMIMQQQQMLQQQQMQQQFQQMQAMQLQLATLGTNLVRPATVMTKKPDRPLMEAGMSEHGWAVFIDSWERYKTMSGITDVNQVRNELRAACSQEVNRLLLGLVETSVLATMSEEELLKKIKTLSIQGVHKEVHRHRFSKMEQDEGESITHFVARLKEHAALCDFKVPCQSTTCDCTVSYLEDMGSNQMVSGLCDKEHQTKLLAEATTLTTFQKKFDRLMSLETTDKSLPHLKSDTNIPPLSNTAASKSAYR